MAIDRDEFDISFGEIFRRESRPAGGGGNGARFEGGAGNALRHLKQDGT